MVPIRVVVNGRAYSYRAVRHPTLLPLLAGYLSHASQGAFGRTFGNQTLSTTVEVRYPGLEPARASAVFAGVQAAAEAAAFATAVCLIGDIADMLSMISRRYGVLSFDHGPGNGSPTGITRRASAYSDTVKTGTSGHIHPTESMILSRPAFHSGAGCSYPVKRQGQSGQGGPGWIRLPSSSCPPLWWLFSAPS